MSTSPKPSRIASRLRRDGVYRLTADQFMQIAEAGIFKDDRVELLGGLIYRKMTKNSPHNYVSGEFHETLVRILPAGWFADKEIPLRIPPHWQPEPDIMIVRGRRRDYLAGWIGPGDLALLIEVSDESSRYRDRGTKLRGYARAGVPAYWIMNLVHRQIEAHADPTGPADHPAYRQTTIYRIDDEIPLMLDGREVARFRVRDLLP